MGEGGKGKLITILVCIVVGIGVAVVVSRVFTVQYDPGNGLRIKTRFGKKKNDPSGNKVDDVVPVDNSTSSNALVATASPTPLPPVPDATIQDDDVVAKEMASPHVHMWRKSDCSVAFRTTDDHQHLELSEAGERHLQSYITTDKRVSLVLYIYSPHCKSCYNAGVLFTAIADSVCQRQGNVSNKSVFAAIQRTDLPFFMDAYIPTTTPSVLIWDAVDRTCYRMTYANNADRGNADRGNFTMDTLQSEILKHTLYRNGRT